MYIDHKMSTHAWFSPQALEASIKAEDLNVKQQKSEK